MPERLRLGTRGSALSLAQAAEAEAALAAIGLEAERVVIRTQGDRDQRSPLSEIGGRGVFARALEEALVAGEIDVAVHSAKDVPTTLLEGTELAAVPRRGDVRDALVSRDGSGLASLPPGARVGTGSRRRAAQLLAARPDLEIVPIRGNVDTRLRKLADGEFDAIVLAAAGLSRLGRLSEASELLPINVMLPAPGQGALLLQTRREEAESLRACSDPASELSVRAERAMLHEMGAGCTLPIGALAHARANTITLAARLLDERGEQQIDVQRSGEDAEFLGNKVGKMLKERDSAIITRGDWPDGKEGMHA